MNAYISDRCCSSSDFRVGTRITAKGPNSLPASLTDLFCSQHLWSSSLHLFMTSPVSSPPSSPGPPFHLHSLLICPPRSPPEEPSYPQHNPLRFKTAWLKSRNWWCLSLSWEFSSEPSSHTSHGVTRQRAIELEYHFPNYCHYILGFCLTHYYSWFSTSLMLLHFNAVPMTPNHIFVTTL